MRTRSVLEAAPNKLAELFKFAAWERKLERNYGRLATSHSQKPAVLTNNLSCAPCRQGGDCELLFLLTHCIQIRELGDNLKDQSPFYI